MKKISNTESDFKKASLIKESVYKENKVRLQKTTKIIL